MYPILRAVVVAALLALAPAVFCQTPTLRTEDLPMQTVSVADSQADVALRDLVRNPDLYIDGPHVLEGVRIVAPRNETRAFGIVDRKDGVAVPSLHIVCSGPSALRTAMLEDPDLAFLDARVRFRLRPVLEGRYLSLEVDSIEFRGDGGDIVRTVR